MLNYKGLYFTTSPVSLLCFKALLSLLLFYCLMSLSTAAGKKVLNANCLDFVCHKHCRLDLYCLRHFSKTGWGKAEHIFTVAIKTQWRDFWRQLYVSWQLLFVPSGASYGGSTINNSMRNKVCICASVWVITSVHQYVLSCPHA